MLRPVTALVLLTTLGVPLLQHHQPRDHAPVRQAHLTTRFENPVLRPAAPTQEPSDPSTGTLGPDVVVVPTPTPTHAPRAVVRPL